MTRAARIREATTIGVSVDAFAVTDAGLQPALRCMELRTRAATVCHSSPREHIPAADTSPTELVLTPGPLRLVGGVMKRRP